MLAALFVISIVMSETSSPGLHSIPLSVMSSPLTVTRFRNQPFGGLITRNMRPPTRPSSLNVPSSLTDELPRDDIAGPMLSSVGPAINRIVETPSGAGPSANVIFPDALAPRVPVTTMPAMSSPATLTLAIANSRSCGEEATAAGRSLDTAKTAMAPDAALIMPASPCTRREYSPGATPLTVNEPSLLVHDEP